MDPNQPASNAPLLPEERSRTPLDGPHIPFLQPRGSIASSATPTDTDFDGAHFVLQSDSQNPLSPVKNDPANTRIGQEHFDRGFDAAEPAKRNHRRWLILAALAAFLVVAAVVLGVIFGVVVRRKSSSTASESARPSASAPSSTPSGRPVAGATVIYGVDGTEVTTEQGTTFTYRNPFGGYFVHDSSNPFNNDARAQSYTPPLNTSWDWSRDQVLGLAILVSPLKYLSLTLCYCQVSTWAAGLSWNHSLLPRFIRNIQPPLMNGLSLPRCVQILAPVEV